MSQAKVDKRKYEKIHRKEIERKKKIKTLVTCVVTALVIGAIVGVPLGIRYYKEQPKFVGDSTVDTFISNYIDNNHAEDIAGLGSTEDASEETAQDESDALQDAVEEAVGEELDAVDSENVDELIGSGDEETSSEENTSEESTSEEEDKK